MGLYTLRFSVPGLTPVDSGTIVVSPPATAPNPLLLPIGANQKSNAAAYESRTWYNAAGVSQGSGPVVNMPKGLYYRDPVTNVRVWRLTDGTVYTNSNEGGTNYSEGGFFCSQPWGPNRDQYTISVTSNISGQVLVDFSRATGPYNWRSYAYSGVWGESQCFSPIVGEERILYVMTGGQIRRYDTGTMALSESGLFPKTFAGLNTAAGWFQMSWDGDWFCAINATDNGAIMWRKSTNTTYNSPTFSPFDEPYICRTGRYVVINQSGNPPFSVWDSVTGVVATMPAGLPNGQTPLGIYHSARLDKYLIGNVDLVNYTPFPWNLETNTNGNPSFVTVSAPQAPMEHCSGTWNQIGKPDQWMLTSLGYGPWPGIDISNAADMALLFMRVVGTVPVPCRVLCHHYSLMYTNVQYPGQPKAFLAQDGTFACFTSCMNRPYQAWPGPNRTDAFLVEVPLG